MFTEQRSKLSAKSHYYGFIGKAINTIWNPKPEPQAELHNLCIAKTLYFFIFHFISVYCGLGWNGFSVRKKTKLYDSELGELG